MDEHRVRFAPAAAADAARVAKSRGWDAVLVGDPRRAGPACDELERAGVPAVPIDNVLDWMRPAALAQRLAPDVERVRTSSRKTSRRRPSGLAHGVAGFRRQSGNTAR